MTEIAVWKQPKFEGSSLIPTPKSASYLLNPQQVVGRENVEVGDLIVPSLALLQGTSDAVTSGVPGCRPGMFQNTNTGELFEPPLKCVIVHYYKSNAFFPQHDKYPESKTKQSCISRDGKKGTRYGLCEPCGICSTWMEDGRPPMGAENHVFVVLTESGPATLRFARSSYKAGSKFVSNWGFSPNNLWTHPVIINIKGEPKQLPGGKSTTYQTMSIHWLTDEVTPEPWQKACEALYTRVSGAHDAGKFGDDTEGLKVGEFD